MRRTEGNPILTSRTPLNAAHSQIIAGEMREQKAQLVEESTDSLERVLGKKPEYANIILQAIAEQDWGYSGPLTDERKKRD
jgi:4-oxalocrotonate tautomerase